MSDVSVSILSVDKENATHTFYNLETARPEYFHIDVMDGKFVENNNLELMKDYAITISHISNIPLDVHLMVENVEEIMDEYMDLLPDRITFHIEAISDSERIFNIIDELKSNGIKIGIAIKPNTKIEEIKPYLNYIHQVLVMTVEPGKGGQKLIPETLEKIKELRSFVDDNGIDIDIEADGGINKETAEEVRNAGTDVLVSGAFIINSENQREAVEIIRGTK
jgi:ribulose-phosphate 3-epimerase